jgi:hypothetical protein
MTKMAILARYGNVQPDVYGEMDIFESEELAHRVLKLAQEDEERNMQLHLELTKAIMKSNGAKL